MLGDRYQKCLSIIEKAGVYVGGLAGDSSDVSGTAAGNLKRRLSEEGLAMGERHDWDVATYKRLETNNTFRQTA